MPALVGCVPEELLQELWLKDGSGVQDSADQHHEQAADGEVLELEKLDVHQRILLLPLPPDETDHAKYEHDAKRTNEVGGEPVVLFTLIEHDLKATHGEREKA